MNGVFDGFTIIVKPHRSVSRLLLHFGFSLARDIEVSPEEVLLSVAGPHDEGGYSTPFHGFTQLGKAETAPGIAIKFAILCVDFLFLEDALVTRCYPLH